MKNSNVTHAEALAAALEGSDYRSDEAEKAPKPLAVARKALRICNPGTTQSDWEELIDCVDQDSIPPSAYYRALGDLCHRALRRPGLTEELAEELAFAWGFYEALLLLQSFAPSDSAGEVEM